MADISTQTQIVREAPEIEAYKLGLIQEAQRLYNQPMNIPAVEAAGLSPTEQQAIDFGKQGVGAFEPYLQAGSQGVTQGMDLAQRGALAAGAVQTAPQFQEAQNVLGRGVSLTESVQTAPQFQAAQNITGQGIGALGAGVQGLMGSAQGYDPRSAFAFMNPYQQAVTQNALGEMRRQADIAGTGAAAQAVRAGAFGGTREGVQRAETERGIQDLMQQRIMQDYAQNYVQAQQAAQQAFEAQQGRQLAASQALGQSGMQYGQLGQNIGALTGQQASIDLQRAQQLAAMGQGIGALTGQQAGIDLSKAATLGALGSQIGTMGTQYAGLGEAAQRLGAADTSLLAGLGGLERQNQQAQLDAMRATQLQETMAPYQQLGFVSDIFRGAPTTQMSLTSQSAPSVSPLQSAVGLGIAGLSTAAGAKTAGLF